MINFTDEVQEVPESFAGNVDVLTGKMVESGEKMAKYDVKIVKVDNRSIK